MRLNHMLVGIAFLFSFASIAFAESSESPHSHSTTANKPQPTEKNPDQINQEQELGKLTPEEYRLLVLGTQIYLGRFGYGIGPFTGKFDQQTQYA